VKLAQFRGADGSAAVGMLDGDDIVSLPIPAGYSTDRAIVAYAMGDLPIEPRGDRERLADVTLLTPLTQPPSIRDYMMFEGHVANSLRRFKRDVPERWYAEPSFYFTSPHRLLASGQSLPMPTGGLELDYELELAAVVGRDLVDATPDEAADAIAGFTILNDFSLRDRQALERPLGLGPSKSKDFATGLGPVLVTVDELPGTRRRPELSMEAWVNGELWSAGRSETMHFDFGEAIALAAADSRVAAGDVFGSGTVTSGCVMELLALDDDRAHWLGAGDIVELKIAGIGTLTTTITARG
jgi:2-keto-4-pentenoate hydratase/2-oxohepta-3-ene-1,7-dioic acid hydratase in catechol pathway